MKKVISNTRKLCFGEKGQNYWFNGCMEYLMECLGENTMDYNYWFFSNVTGDSLMQLYSKNINKTAWCPSQNILDESFVKRAFDACGYDFGYFTKINNENRNDFLPRIKTFIDKNIPVLCRGGENVFEYGCICGYNDDELYYLICDTDTLQVFPNQFSELIFVGDKKTRLPLAEVYRNVVLDIPSFISRPSTIDYSFGKQAFLDWGKSFQNNTFENIKEENISVWNVHGTYLCMAGTNGCVEKFLNQALEMNPGMGIINELLPLYKKHQVIFHDLAYRDISGNIDYANGGMQGGFNIKPAVIKNKDLMKPISDKIFESANICTQILEIYKNV